MTKVVHGLSQHSSMDCFFPIHFTQKKHIIQKCNFCSVDTTSMHSKTNNLGLIALTVYQTSNRNLFSTSNLAFTGASSMYVSNIAYLKKNTKNKKQILISDWLLFLHFACCIWSGDTLINNKKKKCLDKSSKCSLDSYMITEDILRWKVYRYWWIVV